jgi:hypothetical protein
MITILKKKLEVKVSMLQQDQLLTLFDQVEKFLKRLLLIFFLGCVATQMFILSDEEHQPLANKAIRYEGVYHHDPVEAKATLQRR